MQDRLWFCILRGGSIPDHLLLKLYRTLVSVWTCLQRVKNSCHWKTQLSGNLPNIWSTQKKTLMKTFLLPSVMEIWIQSSYSAGSCQVVWKKNFKSIILSVADLVEKRVAVAIGVCFICKKKNFQKSGSRDVYCCSWLSKSGDREQDFVQHCSGFERSVMDGYNVCIFAYGQTGSGKTHTMCQCGPSGGFTKDMGINYLALNNLFQMSNRRKDIVTYDIHVQMVEIYNEQVRDLLPEDYSTSKLEIRSCTNDNGLSLPDAIMHSVKSSTDVLNLMKLGEVNRVVSSTAINNRSSRSHSILTVHVHGKDTSGSIIHSCLHLVDLAGSELVDKSEVTGDRLKEAQYNNKSLSCLGDVIAALAQKNSHIPYRNSKLTLLL